MHITFSVFGVRLVFNVFQVCELAYHRLHKKTTVGVATILIRMNDMTVYGVFSIFNVGVVFRSLVKCLWRASRADHFSTEYPRKQSSDLYAILIKRSGTSVGMITSE